ncbi:MULTISPECIES: copper transporter [unclassified Romboutsia]|uniref:copper transporter n=1 Tax=unclassified Romboutsia TaxID=2626894 RepID=UPI00082178CF|nr:MULTISPECIES: copper transporter [unclassified Romboutsia]SCH11369.1 Protein of uncharacterised function (DUF3186) [uncultured Clostridium sp.]
MHINMKYYIVTIGAIFISLGIGILVGFNLNYDQELSKQQAQIIDDLDAKFEDLRKNNNELEALLKDTNAEYDELVNYINNNSDKLISEELTDQNIGIISINNNINNEYIENCIGKANGNIVFNINLNSNITDKTTLKEISTKLGTEINSTEELIAYISDCLKDDNSKETLEYLQELKVLDLNKLEDNYSAYTSVVLSSDGNAKDNEAQFESIDKLLIEKLREEKKNLVAVESLDTKTSNIKLYSDNKVTTIDNINQGSGQLALVLVLKDGNVVGDFGVSDTATSLIPYKK